jgi:hypothetical protein
MGVKVEKKDQEPSQNPNPSHAEGFGTPRVSIVLEADSGAARKVGHPPDVRDEGFRSQGKTRTLQKPKSAAPEKAKTNSS